MTASANDPRLLTAEQIAEIRADLDHQFEVLGRLDRHDARDLLRHIDALTDQAAELRARAERAEAGARVWKMGARHLHGQRAFHRTMQKWAADTIRAREGEIETLRADVRRWHDAHDKLVDECYGELPAQEEGGYDGPDTLPLCIRALAARAEQAEAIVKRSADAMATDPRDWSVNRTDAWLWCLLIGWGNAIGEIVQRHGSAFEEAERLHRAAAGHTEGTSDVMRDLAAEDDT